MMGIDIKLILISISVLILISMLILTVIIRYWIYQQIDAIWQQWQSSKGSLGVQGGGRVRCSPDYSTPDHKDGDHDHDHDHGDDDDDSGRILCSPGYSTPDHNYGDDDHDGNDDLMLLWWCWYYDDMMMMISWCYGDDDVMMLLTFLAVWTLTEAPELGSQNSLVWKFIDKKRIRYTKVYKSAQRCIKVYKSV